jgi:uncharacterized protein YkwD
VPAPDPSPAPAPDPVNTVYIPNVPDSDYDIGWAGLSGEEQYVVELINRARLDPDGELARQSDGFAAGVTSAPKQALAVDPVLADVARDHSQDMDDRNFFAHTNPDGDSPFDRTSDAGYDGNGAGENIGVIGGFSISDTQARAQAHHDNLWDSDGHQQNFMNPNWNEIGVGYDYGDHQFNSGGTTYPESTFVTEMLGRDGNTYLTGTVIDDSDGDEFYDIGEGQGDVKITAYNASGTYTTSTWDAGGYTLELPPGTYTVVFHGGDLDGVFETQVTIGSQNVKLDVVEDRDAVDGQVTTSLTLSATAPLDAGEALLADLDTGEPLPEDMPADGGAAEADEDLLAAL